MSTLQPRTILVVDRNPRNLELLMQALARHGFQTLAAPDLGQFDQLIAHPGSIELALVDIDGFDAGIWDRCHRLHERQIEVLLLVRRHAMPRAQVESARCGARAVLPKPLSPRLLTQMVQDLMEEPQ